MITLPPTTFYRYTSSVKKPVKIHFFSIFFCFSKIKCTQIWVFGCIKFKLFKTLCDPHPPCLTPFLRRILYLPVSKSDRVAVEVRSSWGRSWLNFLTFYYRMFVYVCNEMWLAIIKGWRCSVHVFGSLGKIVVFGTTLAPRIKCYVLPYCPICLV